VHSSANVVPIPCDGPRDVVPASPAQVADAPVELVERGLGGALVLHRFVIVGHLDLSFVFGRCWCHSHQRALHERQEATGVSEFEYALHRSRSRPDRERHRVSEADFVQPQNRAHSAHIDEGQFRKIKRHATDRGKVELVECRLEDRHGCEIEFTTQPDTDVRSGGGVNGEVINGSCRIHALTPTSCLDDAGLARRSRRARLWWRRGYGTP
jgi:hypothetical protein